MSRTRFLLRVPVEPTYIEEAPHTFITSSAPPHEEPAPAPIQMRPLETLQAFQDSLREAKDLNGLLGAFVQSLQQDAGFDRVGLALLNPSDSDLLVGRLVLGGTPLAPYLRALSGSLSHEHRFFLKVLNRLDPLLVTDFTNQAAGAMKQEFVDTWKPVSGILASLRVGTRPIGLIYCDRGMRSQPLLLQEYHAFLLFFMHTTLGLNRRAGVLSGHATERSGSPESPAHIPPVSSRSALSLR